MSKSDIRRICESAKHIELEHAIAADLDRYDIEPGMRVAIQGTGGTGRIFLEAFNNSPIRGCKIDCFIDKRAEKDSVCLGYPVYKAQETRFTDEVKNDIVVFVAVMMSNDEYEQNAEYLKSCGFSKIVYVYDLLFYCASCIAGISDRQVFENEIDDIIKAYGLMEDKHSKEVFSQILKAHATLRYDTKALSPDTTQYFDVDVPFRHKYKTFVDCGAYVGDTLEKLLQYHKVRQYIGFEPDIGNYKELSKTAQRLISKSGNAVLLPLSVGNENGFLQFEANANGNSAVNDTGDVTVQTVRLDDVLSGYSELLIKMDVEGSEIAALNGARGIIAESKPDLAVCVYHKVSDLWRIPLLLNKWVPEYKMYMRNHCSGTFETVLYATV